MNQISPAIGFSARIQASPYFEATRRWGCQAYSVYNHTYLPLFYESPEADYWRLVRHVTLWDVSCQRQVEIKGPDAARLVQYMTPRNLSDWQVGQCKYMLLTADDGGIVNDPLALKLADDHFWLSLSDSDVELWARGIAHGKGFDVSICIPDVWPLQLQGPAAIDVAKEIFGEEITDLGYYRHRDAEIEGVPVVVSRTGWSAERGYEIYLKGSEHGNWLWEFIMDRGRPYGIAPAGPSQPRRIEAGILSYGADMGLMTNPLELGMSKLVDLDQDADFLGKSALKEIAAAGVKRRLVGIGLDGFPLETSNLTFWQLCRDGAPAGIVTSACYSPHLERNIALALVQTSLSELGTDLVAETAEGPRKAVVEALPFAEKRQTS